MKSGPLILAVLAAATLLVVIFVLIRLRRTAWLKFAESRGLEHGVGPDGVLRVTGRIEGREFRLEARSPGSDTGLGAVEEERLTLGLRGDVPAGLTVNPRPNPLAELGEPSLSDLAGISAADGDGLDRWLTDRRREALLHLIRHAGSDRAGVGDGAVWLSRRTAFRAVDAIEEDLGVLLDVSRELEA